MTRYLSEAEQAESRARVDAKVEATMKERESLRKLHTHSLYVVEEQDGALSVALYVGGVHVSFNLPSHEVHALRAFLATDGTA